MSGRIRISVRNGPSAKSRGSLQRRKGEAKSRRKDKEVEGSESSNGYYGYLFPDGRGKNPPSSPYYPTRRDYFIDGDRTRTDPYYGDKGRSSSQSYGYSPQDGGGSLSYNSRGGYPAPSYGDYDDGGSPDHAKGAFSGYGHSKVICCPLVVKPLVILALLGGIAAATAFFNVLITMNIPAPAAGGGGNKRRRRAGAEGGLSSSAAGRLGDVLLAGREKVACPCQLWQIVVDCKSRQTCLSVLLPFDLVCH